MTVVVLVPVLERPHRVRPFLEHLRATAPGARPVFICDPSDRAQMDAVAVAGADQLNCAGSYARKINHAVAGTTEPLLFFAADDLEFRPGWLAAATEAISAGAQVVGVNDLIDRPHRPDHATHFLVTREYAELPTIDGARGPLCEEYHHSFVDDELIGTATHRGAYAYAAAAHVRHLHPMAGTAEDDPTYRRGRRRFRQDHRIYTGRERLWKQS